MLGILVVYMHSLVVPLLMIYVIIGMTGINVGSICFIFSLIQTIFGTFLDNLIHI